MTGRCGRQEAIAPEVVLPGHRSRRVRRFPAYGAFRRFRVTVLTTTALLGAATYASGQSVVLDTPSFVEGNPRKWIALLTVNGQRHVTLRVALPEAKELVATLAPVGNADADVFRRGRGHWDVKVHAAGETRLRLTMQGATTRFINSTTVKYTWYESGVPNTNQKLFNGPVESPGSAGSAGEAASAATAAESRPFPIRLAFGTGLSVRTDDAIDFNVDTEAGRLFVKNDSRLRASGILGALFRVKRLSDTATFDALTSLEFTNQTNRVLDAYMVGVAFSLPTFSIGVGMSFRMGGGTWPRIPAGGETTRRGVEGPRSPRCRLHTIRGPALP